MEHACAQCGSMVDDGRPFCPQCRAPQITVQIAVPNAGTVVEVERTPAHQFPEAIGGWHSGRDRVAVHSAIKAGLFGILIGMIPFVGIVLTGSLAVFFYRRQSTRALTARSAARLGGAAGAVAAGISSLFTILRLFVFHAQQEYHEAMLRFMTALGISAADAEAALRRLFTPSGMALALLLGILLSVGLAAIGGALAAALLPPPRR